jgi:hypothetical protein
MLIARDFVFLHIPKTGGTFVQRTILEFISADTGSYTHARYSDLPATALALPGFYIVRNPWDWYVSWYHWGHQRASEIPAERAQGNPQKHAIWQLMDGGRASFAEAVTAACTGEFDTAAAFPGFDCAELDLYSCYVRSIVGEALERDDYTALRYERLRRDVGRYLRQREEVGRDLLRTVRDAPAVRTSRRGAYPGYFDEPLRRLVGRKTRWLRDRFGYRFGEKPDRRSAVGADGT